MNKVKSILILGKTWFDKINGNTYCAAKVYFDGKEVLAVPFQYGYGNFYEQAAVQALQEKGLIKLKEYETFWQYCNRKKITKISQVSECLKRDVVAWGKE